VKQAWDILQKKVFYEKLDKLKHTYWTEFDLENFEDLICFLSQTGFEFGDEIYNIDGVIDEMVTTEYLKEKYELKKIQREYSCEGCFDSDTPRRHTCVLASIPEGEVKDHIFPLKDD
jgi:hypothetical protein